MKSLEWARREEIRLKAEIEAAELELTQPITDERRTQLTKQIAAAKAYLADPDAFLKS